MSQQFIDFAALKEQVSFEDVISHLDIKVKRSGNQWRGACPSCDTGGDRALVITEGKGYYCFGGKKGGDQIALAAHILNLPARDAAQALAERAGIVPVQGTRTRSTVQPSTVPAKANGSETQKLAALAYLEHDHEAVTAVGLDPKFCEAHGIGYAPRGVVRGSVAIPFRDEDGVLLGYFGVQELTYIPPDFTPNVISLDKKRA